MSRSLCSQEDVTEAILITVEVHFSMLAASSKFEEGLEQLLELPDPSHPGCCKGALKQWRPFGLQKFEEQLFTWVRSVTQSAWSRPRTRRPHSWTG